MGDLEKVGLLKMDFLGLRTLTLLDNAVQADREDARRDDRPVQAAAGRPGDLSRCLQRGDAKGVFQFESTASASCSSG